jgi:hypothetical protein
MEEVVKKRMGRPPKIKEPVMEQAIPAFIPEAKPVEAKPKEEMETITIDLGESAQFIQINGHQLMHGHTYTLPKKMIPDLMYTMYATKAHDENFKFGNTKHIISPRRLS